MQRITVISIKAPRLVATRLGQTQDCCQFIVVWHTHRPTHHTPLAATNTESHTKPKPGCSDCATCAARTTVKRANCRDAARWETWISESGRKRAFWFGLYGPRGVWAICFTRRRKTTRKKKEKKRNKDQKHFDWIYCVLITLWPDHAYLLLTYTTALPSLPWSVLCIFEAIFIWVSMSLVVVRVSVAGWYGMSL